MYCNKCGNQLIKSYPNNKYKLRTNIIIFENGKAICKCQQCHSDVVIPVALELPTNRKMKFYVLEKGKHEQKPEKSRKETKVP